MKLSYKSKALFYVIFLLLFGCKKNKAIIENNPLKNNKGNIVLIFKQPVENWKFEIEDRGFLHMGRYEISFNKDSPIPVQWSPDYLKKSDTLIIENVEQNLEIRHKYKGLDEFSYLLKPNDTIVFEYKKQLPIAKINNREIKKYDINFEMLKRELVVKDDFPEEVKFNSPFFYMIENQPENQSEVKSIEYKNKKLIKAKSELILEKKLLDSLLNKELLSLDVYNFYVAKNFYSFKSIEVKDGKATENNYHLKKENDSLLNFSFYIKYLKSIVNSEFEKKTKIINYSNAKIPDYRIVYDSINSSNLFSREVKKHLSFLWLDLIINNFSISDIDHYFQKFKQVYKDSILNNHFNQEYKLASGISSNLDLKDVKNNKTNLQKIINANKGKVIFVDFWASWCAPCRRAMPSSIILKKEYKNEKIVFVYLALNDKNENWKKAIEEEGLKDFDYNYIVENSKSSKLIDDLNLKSIPRYILYDKQGKLVHQNAPPPHSGEIRNLLNKYLKE